MRIRKYNIKKLYGLDWANYVEMFKAQGGECPICRRKLDSLSRTPSVDHCHTTGENRGILCNECNRGLGLFGDDRERILRAAEYLRTHRGLSTS